MSCYFEMPSLPSYHASRDQTSPETPNLGISLDLPSYADYLPTYWPGQSINGKLRVQLSTPVKVSHLRVVLYGNVQVYGTQRNTPLSNGLFDYQKNIQLISKGLRIIKRPTNHIHSSTMQLQNLETDNHCNNTNENNNDEPSPPRNEATRQRRWTLHSKPKEKANKSKKQKQDDEEKYVQNLVKQIADNDFDKDTSHGAFVNEDFVHGLPSEENQTFNLDANTCHVGFSITVPISKTLPGTFDHKHYPVTYRLVAIMKCSDNNQNEILCYSTTKVCLEPYIDVQSPKFSSHIQSSPVKILVPGSGSIFRGFYSCLLSSSSVMNSFFIKSISKSRASSINTLLCASPQLRGYLELPKQAFERSESIPLRINLLNTCSNFKIHTLKIEVQLAQQIIMTCSFGETTEQKLITAKKILFRSNDGHTAISSGSSSNYISFDSPRMCFDLSKLMKVPSDCVYSIPSVSTRDVFYLTHDINVRLEIEGALVTKTNHYIPKIDMTEVVYSPSQESASTLSESYIGRKQSQKARKIYRMELNPLPIVIGCSGYENKIDV